MTADPPWLIAYRQKKVTRSQRAVATLVGNALGRVYQLGESIPEAVWSGESTPESSWAACVALGRFEEAVRTLRMLLMWDQALEQKAQQGFRNHFEFARTREPKRGLSNPWER